MTYPTLPEDSARDLFEKYKSDSFCEKDLEAVTVHVEGFSFDEATAIDLCNLLWEVVQREKKGRSGWGMRFERSAAAIVHERLNLSPVVAGDPKFWRWLTFAAGGELAELVDWRYKKGETESAPERYYGFGKSKEGLYGYLWLCADTVYDPTLEDPYELTRRGDVDVWQSHIVRIDFGSVPQFARAFIRFVFPSEDEKPLSRDEYRQLAKELTRRNASMSFELLDEEASLAFVDEVWRERAEWEIGRGAG